MTNKKSVLSPKEIAESIYEKQETVRNDAFEEAAKLFKGDNLFVHSCIKEIMQQHYLNPNDKNLQAAFIRVANGVKKMAYPKKSKSMIKWFIRMYALAAFGWLFIGSSMIMAANPSNRTANIWIVSIGFIATWTVLTIALFKYLKHKKNGKDL